MSTTRLDRFGAPFGGCLLFAGVVSLFAEGEWIYLAAIIGFLFGVMINAANSDPFDL